MPLKIKNKKTNNDASCQHDKQYNMRRDGITQSMISNFLVCRKRGYFAINRWEARVQNQNTFFGTVFHEILDKAYSICKVPTRRQIDNAIDDLYSRRASILSGTADDEKTAATAACLAELYFKHYEKDFKTKRFGKPEQVFDVDFHGFRLLGKIDGNFFSGKSLWMMEHKTKGRIEEEKLVQHLSIDFQNLFYIVLWKLKHKQTARGVLYNVVRTPGFRNEGSIKAYLVKLTTDVKKRPDHYFKRWEVIYTKENIALFEQELLYKLQFIEDLTTGKQPVFRNEWACESPFPCRYIEACSSGNLNAFKQKEKLFEELTF